MEIRDWTVGCKGETTEVFVQNSERTQVGSLKRKRYQADKLLLTRFPQMSLVKDDKSKAEREIATAATISLLP